jgi:5-methylcytosine-specific restriction enzyme subunit McrC
LLTAGPGAFLIDLGRAFEDYLARSLAEVLPSRWSLDVQPCFPLGPLVLQPDLVLRRGGEVRAVLDAKWKRLAGGPEAADVHQVLAYAAITGARRVGLVYPGARWARKTFAAAGVEVSLFRVQVVGPLAECAASVRKLARAVRVCRPCG